MALLKKIVVTCLLFTSTSLGIFGQNSETTSHKVNLHLDGTALLGIATGDIEMQIDGVTEAGAALNKASENSDTRLRISSLAESGVYRLITVKMSKVLSGTELTVQALPPVTTNFNGEAGKYSEMVTMNTDDKVIIDNIGTCWSGTDENDGYVIKYTYKINPSVHGENINIDEQTKVTVTFTLSDTK